MNAVVNHRGGEAEVAAAFSHARSPPARYTDAMSSKISTPSELQRVLDSQSGSPVYLLDAGGTATHVVLPLGEARRLFDEYLRRELQVGFDQADRGRSEPWDVDVTLAEAHRRHADRKTP